ncbi:MAG: lyase family protein, partial [Candidatus Gracilibacteria bacterium]
MKSNTAVNGYIISKNLEQDGKLLPYDIQSSIAHAEMLKKVGLISKAEGEKLIKTLKEINKLFNDGKFKLKQEDEDCHTAIENYLVQKLDETGKKIHTGRSRNDQVLTAMRLYSKA